MQFLIIINLNINIFIFLRRIPVIKDPIVGVILNRSGKCLRIIKD